MIQKNGGPTQQTENQEEEKHIEIKKLFFGPKEKKTPREEKNEVGKRG